MIDWRVINAEWARTLERYAAQRLDDVRRLRARVARSHDARDVDLLARARVTLDAWIRRALDARRDAR